MKAILVPRFGGPEVLKFEEVPDLRAGPGQILINIKAVGVNPVETYIASGKYGPRQFPFIPGTDAAGLVEAVGDGVTSIHRGDRVYTHATLTGAYAEKALCLETQVHLLPTKIAFEEGAALGIPYATSHRALFRRGKPVAGETILVHGASGGVGTASVQFARAFGLTVFGTASTEAGRKQVLEQGAHHALDHGDPNYLKQLLDLTGGRGVDLILEMAAHINLGKDLTVLAKYGRVVVVGSRGPIEITPRETMSRDADIRGMTLMNATEPELKGIHAAITAGLENGTLRPIIGKEIPLAEAEKAFTAVLAPGARGKIVLIP